MATKRSKMSVYFNERCSDQSVTFCVPQYKKDIIQQNTEQNTAKNALVVKTISGIVAKITKVE